MAGPCNPVVAGGIAEQMQIAPPKVVPGVPEVPGIAVSQNKAALSNLAIPALPTRSLKERVLLARSPSHQGRGEGLAGTRRNGNKEEQVKDGQFCF